MLATASTRYISINLALNLILAGVRRHVRPPLRPLRWQATRWTRRLWMLLAEASTKTGTPTLAGWHVVPDCRVVTSILENLKHPEAAVDGQLACRSAALTTHEGVPCRSLCTLPAWVPP